MADDALNPPVPPPLAGEARTGARDVIAAELADGEWHEAGPILALCAELRIGKRAAQRATQDVGIEVRRERFPAATSWRPQRRQPEMTSPTLVAPVTSVTAGERRDDSDDRDDRQITGNGIVTSGQEELDAEAELERLAAKGLTE